VIIDQHDNLENDEQNDSVCYAAEDDGAATSLAQHVTLTLGITLVALLLAIAVPDISIIFGLLGSTCVALICFILPPIFLLELDPEAGALKKNCLRCFAIGGVALGLLGTYFVIEGLVIGREEEEDYCES